MSTDKIIMNSTIVTIGSTVAASALPTQYGGKGELPSPRLLAGGGLTFLGLSILGDIVPGLAGPIAAALALTALTYYTIPLADLYFTGGAAKLPVGKPPKG